jgi:hypothetical protein
MKEMEYYKWEEEYKPLKNHIDESASVDGYLFMPFGKQWEFIKSFDNDQLWTLVISDLEHDTTSWEIVSGIHIVNREGYLITEKDCIDDLMIIY